MNQQIEPKSMIPPVPVHPIAALVTIALDNVFGGIEIIAPPSLILTCVIVGSLTAVVVSFIQRYLAEDKWEVAIVKGLALGILAGVPYQFTGTAAGALLLAWAGIGLIDKNKLPPP